MSGEYYCIEEVGESSNYPEAFDSKTARSGKANLHNLHTSGDHDSRSTSTKKSQDNQLLEIEEQLQIAESRCNTLKGQLDSMKKNYQKISPRDTIQSRRKHDTNTRSKVQRKRAVLTQPNTSQGTHPQIDTYDDGTGTYPTKSNSSSAMSKAKSSQPPLFRQNSTSISTDHTGAAVKTITNIICGITDSVNRLSQSNEDHTLNYAYVGQPFSNDTGIFGTPFSPRLKKRFHEQQEKMKEMVKESQYPAVYEVKTHTDKASSVSIKSKETALEKWSKQLTSQLKTRATTRSVETTAKAKPTRLGVNDDESQSLLKKRKRVDKRLKTTSKISVTRKLSDSDSHSKKCLPKFSADNLVELYHNVAAKSSDSDDSHRGNKPQLDTRQSAGDFPPNHILPSYHASKTDAGYTFNKSGSRLMQSPRALTAIEEILTVDNSMVRHDYFHHVPKNYQLPTIASKLKRVTKNYLRSFNYFNNFRCIPFCAAKSIGPSHNIGINIQQVMSIIKTRQPITGISPTLAHNINLAAEKLQGSPLSAFVSNLSTRIGGNSTCPLIKRQLNYNKLQEMAKAIPEEPFEEENCEEDFTSSHCKDIDGGNGIVQVNEDIKPCPPIPTTWSEAPDSTRCTCISQKGVPFQKVLSKYQIASSEITPKHYREPQQPRTRQVRSAYNNKQRTAAWVSNGVKENTSIASNMIEQCKSQEESHDQQQLRGKEKNLKAVLKNLHDEFDSLNTRYEELSKCDSKTNPNTLKQLDEMENQLNLKEEEINMVMSLYTEVMALKDQVKKLKERTSCETLYTATSPEKKETKAALHLTHLLHQIQNYQNRYQSKAQF